MFRPRQMQRTLIVGAKNDLAVTIETLHGLDIAHIIDFPAEGEEGLQRGIPQQGASHMSKQLLKLRSSAKLLDVSSESPAFSEKVAEGQVTQDLDRRIQDIELRVFSLVETRARIDEQLASITDSITALQPFADLPIPLELYRGYSSIAVFTGTLADPDGFEQALAAVTTQYAFYKSPSGKAVALFVATEHADEARKLLGASGFAECPVPEGQGLPQDHVQKLQETLDQLQKDRAEKDAELAQVRTQYRDEILASEEYLAVEVQKAEAPVRFATTEHSFIIDCWIPADIVPLVREALDRETKGGLDIEVFPVEEKEQPPTLLHNPRSVRPFEFLLKMYSTPSYRDIDPSFVLSLIFPLFFGLMIGDVGYGVLLIIVGVVFMKKLGDSEAFASIGFYIIVAGIFASIFGLFLFGDMFGLTFAHVPGEEYSWSSLLHVDIPIPSVIHKMESYGLAQLLVLSIIAGFLHIGLGLILGFVTERRLSIKHAISKIGLLCILIALTLIIFTMADWTIGQWLLPLRGSPLEPLLWGVIIPAVKAGVSIGSLVIPYASISLGVAGIVIILGSLGGFGLVEVLEVTGHLISYTRLAAIAVAKGAMAYAFNLIGLGMILSGNILIGIVGVVVIVLMQLIVFALGSLSSGIQAVRLHYVEFFMKFYKGDGIAFSPFGYQRKYTKEVVET